VRKVWLVFRGYAELSGDSVYFAILDNYSECFLLVVFKLDLEHMGGDTSHLAKNWSCILFPQKKVMYIFLEVMYILPLCDVM
jgi:hypothetical protein